MTLSEMRDKFDKEAITSMLAECHGNQLLCARTLGIHRNTLNRIIAKLDIKFTGKRKNVKRPNQSRIYAHSRTMRSCAEQTCETCDPDLRDAGGPVSAIANRIHG